MKVSPRRRARECAVQAIYSWYISQNTVEEVELAFIADQDMKGVDMPYFRKLFRGVVDNVEIIDEILRPYLDRADLILILLNVQFYVYLVTSLNLSMTYLSA